MVKESKELFSKSKYSEQIIIQFLNIRKLLGLFLILRRRDGSETFEAPFPRSVKAGFRGTIRIAFAKRLREFFAQEGDNYVLGQVTCSDFPNIFVIYEIPRDEVVLDERVNMARRD